MITKRPPKYFTVAELCEILDISERYLRGSILPNVSEQHKDMTSRTHYFYGRAVMEAWRRRDKSSSPDELMMGGDSPAIEKYRHIKYLREKLAYEEALGKLIPVEAIHMVLTRIANQINQTTILLRRQFGDRAAEMIEDALTQIQEETSELCTALETPTIEDTADGYDPDEFASEGDEGPGSMVHGEGEISEETLDA